MEYITLLKANIKRHKNSLIGIFVLVITLSITLSSVLTVWINSNSYIKNEISRAGFGELTAWVSRTSDIKSLETYYIEALTNEIENLPDVKQVEIQSLIYSDYIINGQESDSEGQLITFDPEENRYNFFMNDLSGYTKEVPEIKSGEIYVSPSLISMFNGNIGDEISFPIARQGKNATFTIKGYYEDPFMGSSMIGMKGFLICKSDRAKMLQIIQSTGIDTLAKDGAMLHIFMKENSPITVSELNRLLNENTNLPQYTEFVHSKNVISGFMLILQNAFCGIMLSFAVVLFAVVMVVLGHSLGGTIEADFVNMGILKTLGFTSEKLKYIWISSYIGVIFLGMILGLAISVLFSNFLGRITLTTTGILIPTALPLGICIILFVIVILLLVLFIISKISSIDDITPMKTIWDEIANTHTNIEKTITICPKGLYLRLAFRQLFTGRKNYLSACMVAVMLVFFASLVGRMYIWLGHDGKGMMDAFNPADHDIGIQSLGNLTTQDIEKVVLGYTDITDSYLLAMETVSVNNIDYTANVISEPERFHILEGNSSMADNEIVLTEFIAADLGVSIGDTLTVRANSSNAEYVISGIYQCANDMGANIGMSREGYLKIAKDNPRIWCHHYFLADTSQKKAITDTLEISYGGDVHIHENTWPGLFSIISSMQVLIVFLYGVAIVFILVVTILTGSKILLAEQKDIVIYKVIGFRTEKLQMAFALRFAITALVGSVVGIIFATFLTDPLVSTVMKLVGISNFKSNPNIISILFPAIMVIVLFTGFAYLAAGKIKKVNLEMLIAE